MSFYVPSPWERAEIRRQEEIRKAVIAYAKPPALTPEPGEVIEWNTPPLVRLRLKKRRLRYSR